ncbi:MAG: flagellar motor protein MotB [Pirellulaceae bacterium]|nr:flagellar motor protein MotB [Pirellulaceae bacterium]
MAKERSAPPPKLDSVPAWFLTYCDVIILLMTFFVLLLTFASTEPERFEQIQKTLFSGAGSTGLVGERQLRQESCGKTF